MCMRVACGCGGTQVGLFCLHLCAWGSVSALCTWIWGEGRGGGTAQKLISLCIYRICAHIYTTENVRGGLTGWVCEGRRAYPGTHAMLLLASVTRDNVKLQGS